MNIIDIVLADRNDEVGQFPEFVELERSDTHASIRTVAEDSIDVDTDYRCVPIGLVDIIANAPVVATYEELPEHGIVARVRKDGTVANLLTFYKMGDARLYEWLFDEPTDGVRLLHGDSPLAVPTGNASTEEQS